MGPSFRPDSSNDGDNYMHKRTRLIVLSLMALGLTIAALADTSFDTQLCGQRFTTNCPTRNGKEATTVSWSCSYTTTASNPCTNPSCSGSCNYPSGGKKKE